MDEGIGARIKQARKALKPEMSVIKLARLVGVDRQSVYDWQSGKTASPSAVHLLRLAETLAPTVAERPSMIWWLIEGKVPRWLSRLRFGSGGPPEDPAVRDLSDVIVSLPPPARDHLQGLVQTIAQALPTVERRRAPRL